jgi:hypothetical protein
LLKLQSGAESKEPRVRRRGELKCTLEAKQDKKRINHVIWLEREKARSPASARTKKVKAETDAENGVTPVQACAHTNEYQSQIG